MVGSVEFVGSLELNVRAWILHHLNKLPMHAVLPWLLLPLVESSCDTLDSTTPLFVVVVTLVLCSWLPHRPSDKNECHPEVFPEYDFATALFFNMEVRLGFDTHEK